MSTSRAMRPYPFTVSHHAILVGGTISALAMLAACSSNSVSQGASPAASSGASTGSGSAKGLPKNTVVPTELDSRLSSGQANGVFPRTIVHYQGEATINAAPTKVVVISMGQTNAMLTLDMYPIGPTAASGTEGPAPQYLKGTCPDQVSAAETITKVGSRNEPNIEAVGVLKPDPILTNIAGKDDTDILHRNLTAVAPTVVMRDIRQFWKADFLLLADAFSKWEAAQSLLNTLKKEAARTGSTLNSAGTVSLLRKNSGKFRIFGPISFAGSAIADMELQHPDTQQFTNGVSNELSSETLDQADGDWLFYEIQGDKSGELIGQTLRGSLKAVSARHAAKVDNDPFFLNARPAAAHVVRDQIVKVVRG